MVTVKAKDTIYIDVDEEITGIVNRVQSSSKDIIALVLPKRANVLQSIVNMKLLARTGETSGKQVVLITSETKLLPLAGAAGLYVAQNLTSKPYLPPSPKIDGGNLGGEVNFDDPSIDPNTPLSQVAPNAKFADDGDAIEIDNSTKAVPVAAGALAKSKKGGKKLKIPNFGKFRNRLIIGAIVVLLLIVGLIYGLVVAPKAVVTLKAKTTDVPINLLFTADTEAESADKEKMIVRSASRETQKDDTEKVDATGEKDKGKKATGSVAMTAKKCSGNPFDTPSNVPAGTGISANNLTYITQSSVSFTGTGTDIEGCFTYSGNSATSIVSQKAGDEYNVGDSTAFSVAGRSDVSASGSASGGTSDIVKVVSENDINKAKERLNSKQNTVQDDLKKELEKDGYIAVEETFKADPGDYKATPAQGAEASEVSVSVSINYTMLGIKRDDLKELIQEEVNKEQKDQRQMVLSDGLDNAVFSIEPKTDGQGKEQISLKLKTQAITGPEINQDAIKQIVTGKKKGEAEELLKKRSGIQEPFVELKPFWVSLVPKESKIEVIIQQADGTQIP